MIIMRDVEYDEYSGSLFYFSGYVYKHPSGNFCQKMQINDFCPADSGNHIAGSRMCSCSGVCLSSGKLDHLKTSGTGLGEYRSQNKPVIWKTAPETGGCSFIC